MLSQGKLKEAIAEYGQLFVVVYLAIFACVFIAAALAIQMGFELDGVSDGLSGGATLGGAWLATKLTQPIRIVASLALTPILAAVSRRIRGEVKSEEPSPADHHQP